MSGKGDISKLNKKVSTSIGISEYNKARLAQQGSKGETYNEILTRILNDLEEVKE